MIIKTISPVDGRVVAERTAATAAQIDETLQRARTAQREWRAVTLAERAAIIERFCSEFERRGAEIATGLSWQMGRPIRFAPSEVRGTLERARYMTAV
ncbi:MAG TPA: aldehyde dehydrogenase family protein, partial [Steroidobacteraceae bacterium]|nr:aldehyde dehydrogenase family protein [Steroidobacteraceae bacterium]